MNPSRRWILLAGLALSVCVAGEASERPPGVKVEEVVRIIETYYHSAATFQASFLQRYSENHGDVRFESGTAYFSRPGRMRWEYESPEEKLFLVDGKNAWLYVPADRAVTRTRMKESADWRTPLAFLTGKARLSRFCGRIEWADGRITPAGQAAAYVALRCLPGRGASRPASEPRGSEPSPDPEYFREVLLEVKLDSGELARVHVVEPGGAEMEYRFARWRRNPPLPEAMFHFQAPPGVAIVDDSTLGFPGAKQ